MNNNSKIPNVGCGIFDNSERQQQNITLTIGTIIKRFLNGKNNIAKRREKCNFHKRNNITKETANIT